MKLIKTKTTISQLGIIGKELEKLVDVHNTKFAEKLLTVMKSVEEVKNTKSNSEHIKKHEEELIELQKELDNFNEKRFEVLEKYAARDENGELILNRIVQNGKELETYTFPVGQKLIEMTEEEIKEKFGNADLSDYYNKDENGELILNSEGKPEFQPLISVESIAKFAELTALEVEFEKPKKRILELQSISDNEVFEVEVELFETSDLPENLSIKELLVAKSITVEAVEQYNEEVEKLIKQQMAQ